MKRYNRPGAWLSGAIQMLMTAGMLSTAPIVAADRIDKGSAELTVRGCLKGRDLTATEIAGPEDVHVAAGTTFRVSGKREIKDFVKRHNGQAVEVTGVVKKAALIEPGIKIGNTRIVIGSSPISTDPTNNPARNPASRIISLDATGVRAVSESCAAIRP